jgi:hypothetical protein
MGSSSEARLRGARAEIPARLSHDNTHTAVIYILYTHSNITYMLIYAYYYNAHTHIRILI